MQEAEEYDELPDDIERGTIGSFFFEGKDDEAENEIPFMSVHSDPLEFKSRKRRIFIPNTPITVRITKYERSVTTHLLHPYLYTIELEHGNFTWVIRKRYKNMQFLHQQLKLFRATLRIPFPTERHRNDRENFKELKKSGEEEGKSKSSLPRFPNKPEVLIGYNQIDTRMQQLEDYLNKLLNIKLYRDHPDTIEFLSVSHYSFVKDLGLKGREEFVEKQTGSMKRSCDCFGIGECLDCCRPGTDFCTKSCSRWKKRWLFVKDTFLGYVRAKDGILRGVILFDHEFEVASAFSSIRKRDRLQILNLQRRLLIRCDGNSKRQDLANYIKETAARQGFGFTQENKFSSFAPKRSDCIASWYVDGSSYMFAVADAIANAKEEIFIADWWLSPEIYLKRPVIRDNHEWRLDCLLQKKADEGVKIFVLLYKEVKQALGIDSAYSRNTLRKLHSKNIKILRHPDHAKSGVFLWAHHEKIVCVDQTIAFLGGIDLCYGRWDTYEHRLSDFGGFHAGICSIPNCDQIVGTKKSEAEGSEEDSVDLSRKFIASEAGQNDPKQSKEIREAGNGDLVKDEKKFGPEDEIDEKERCSTPELEKNSFLHKMTECFTASRKATSEEIIPEELENEEILDLELERNDSRAESTTPSVSYWIGKDYTNFILKDFCELDAPFQDMFNRNKTPRMPWHDVGVMVHGTAARDVARHFIQRWNAIKIEKVKNIDFYPYLLPKSYERFDPPPTYLVDPQFKVKCQVLRSISAWSGGFLNPEFCEESIHRAYLESILKSEYYIYIENQFFVSLANKNDYVKNRIGEELVSRIVRAHNEKKKFRVYVIIPLLPGFEGEIGRRSGNALHAITHWNYSSLCKGNSSIVERLKELGVKNPFDYITFHGLRKYSQFHEDYVSELIYVHSKLMIVDDRLVICGSANINDRSLLGLRDSEIAIIIKDEEFDEGRMNNMAVAVGKYASSLRKYLFSEHLGILEQSFCAEHGAQNYIEGIDITDPVCDKFYKTWRSVSSKNTSLFEKVFRCYPSDEIKTFKEFDSYVEGERLIFKNPEEALKLLEQIRGHLVDLPLDFLINEDLTPKFTYGVMGLMPMTLWT